VSWFFSQPIFPICHTPIVPIHHRPLFLCCAVVSRLDQLAWRRQRSLARVEHPLAPYSRRERCERCDRRVDGARALSRQGTLAVRPAARSARARGRASGGRRRHRADRCVRNRRERASTCARRRPNREGDWRICSHGTCRDGTCRDGTCRDGTCSHRTGACVSRWRRPRRDGGLHARDDSSRSRCATD